MVTQGSTPASASRDGVGRDGVGRDAVGRRFGWRRRRPLPVPEPPVVLVTDGDPVIIVPSADFVCCSYKGCGALRPLTDASENRPCPGCHRV